MAIAGVLLFSYPHQPWMYNRVRGEYSWMGDGNYLANLSLADRTLGGLHREMESSGPWNNTHVLISSDHDCGVMA